MAVTSFFNSSLEPASVAVHLFYTSHFVLGVFVAHSILLMQACPEYCSLILQDSGKVGPFPEKNIIANRNYHFFVLAGAPAPNIWHKICAKISTANHSPTGVSLPSDIFILYMVDVITTSIVLLLSSIRRHLPIFLIIIQTF